MSSFGIAVGFELCARFVCFVHALFEVIVIFDNHNVSHVHCFQLGVVFLAPFHFNLFFFLVRFLLKMFCFGAVSFETIGSHARMAEPMAFVYLVGLLCSLLLWLAQLMRCHCCKRLFLHRRDQTIVQA